MAKFLLKFFTSLFAFYLLFVTPNYVIADKKSFIENFDDGDYNGWIINNDIQCSNSNWEVVNGMLGMKINNEYCVTNMVPDDELWADIGNNYSVKVDMKFVQGTDHNLAFRFNHSGSTSSYYELHFQSPGDFVLDGVSSGTYNNKTVGSYPNGNTYHIEVKVFNKNIKVYVNRNLVRDYTQNVDNKPTGKIALRIGTGADRTTETWFDNVEVQSLDEAEPTPDVLNVPYFSQNDLPWGIEEYDHAKSMGFSNVLFERWGCAVTSAAMILKYNGFNEFPDGTPVNPGTLNKWLKENNGYDTGGSGVETYSYLKWNAIAVLSKKIFDAGKSQYKLQYVRSKPDKDPGKLDEILSSNIPGIIEVKNKIDIAQSFIHFIVAKGKTDNTYAINDPEWNASMLTEFYNNYYQLDYYIPSYTDLSYIVITVNGNVDILVTSPDGKRTGKTFIKGKLTEYNEIQNAFYSFKEPIGNPDSEGQVTKLGAGYNEFILPIPAEGDYYISTSSPKNNKYYMNITAYQTDGKSKHVKINSSSNSDKIIHLDYHQDKPSVITNINKFNKITNIIKWAMRKGFFRDDRICQMLLRFISSAEDAEYKGKHNNSVSYINQFRNTLAKEYITAKNPLYQTILDDLDSL